MMNTILIANITNSLLEDAISKTCSQKLLLIHEDNLSKKPLGLLISGLKDVYKRQIFRDFVPSIAVITVALSDIIIAIGGMSLFGIPLSVASVGAILMLIGYSVDTDILLTCLLYTSRCV